MTDPREWIVADLVSVAIGAGLAAHYGRGGEVGQPPSRRRPGTVGGMPA